MAVTIGAKSIARYTDTVRMPRSFDRRKPKGCGRAPIVPQGLPETKEGESEQDKREVLREAWKQAMRAVETEICGVMDLMKEGTPNVKWCGRGKDIDTVKRYALPRRAAGNLGRINQSHYSAIWARNRIKELLALVQKEKQQGALA